MASASRCEFGDPGLNLGGHSFLLHASFCMAPESCSMMSSITISMELGANSSDVKSAGAASLERDESMRARTGERRGERRDGVDGKPNGAFNKANGHTRGRVGDTDENQGE
jgi:hypothetical protein